MSPSERRLFDADLPSGFQYRDNFVSGGEEAILVEALGRIEFSLFEMRGVVARRRVAFFGQSYTRGGPAAPLPAFLVPLRARIAEWAGVEPDAFAMTLINEYRAGAPIGWHRDAPAYDVTAGVSLLSPCRMRFRPYLAPRAHAAKRGGLSASGERRTTTHEVTLNPRSAYIIDGEARSHYEHGIPAVKALRYSITFRTLRM